ncbi:MAG: hypothetical protein EU529_15325 [Promethearchaeota archaeon]|nr:MAG: hypothetical protein EU529_15325 [Candidatus Lokiarchaeota archaeon]
MDEKNNSEKKKRFTAPEQIKFKKEISVKSLPKTSISEKTVESEKSSLKSSKLSLTPEDIQLSWKSKIERFQKVNNNITIKSTTEKQIMKVERLVKPSLKIPFKIHQPNLTDEIAVDKEFNWVNKLQQLIEKRDSTLKTSLCERFISELLNSLKEPLKLEDLKYAADCFVQLENL